MQTLTLIRPDDWHVHLRDGSAMAAVVGHTARRFARAIVMPNLQPPVTTTALAGAYRGRILDALPPDARFEPLMTLYLTDETSPEEIRRAAGSGFVHGCKLYPAGATTHSDAGVTRIEAAWAALEAMAEVDLPLLVHGEVTDPEVDVFDREAVFIERVLAPLVERFPALRVVFEHVTTREAVQFVDAAGDRVAATITPQHLLCNRNELLAGALRPHYYCLPVLKSEPHRLALVEAATGGHPRFFLGTDSAPHERGEKESACGCAGSYTAYAALELYAEVFEAAGALDRFEAFASFHGPDFYRLPRNRERVELRRETWTPPPAYRFGDGEVVPFRGTPLAWRLADRPS